MKVKTKMEITDCCCNAMDDAANHKAFYWDSGFLCMAANERTYRMKFCPFCSKEIVFE